MSMNINTSTNISSSAFRSLLPIVCDPNPHQLDMSCIGMDVPLPLPLPTRTRSQNHKKRTLSQINDDVDEDDDDVDEDIDEDENEFPEHTSKTRPKTPKTRKTSSKRRKRKPNRAHREIYPHLPDDQIRKKLAAERKAKNRRSAQESRERRKKQEIFLTAQLPKGLQLKQELLNARLSNIDDREDDEKFTEKFTFLPELHDASLGTALACDDELRSMHHVLQSLVANAAKEWDDVGGVAAGREAVWDSLIEEVLQCYVRELANANGENNDDEDDDDDADAEEDGDGDGDREVKLTLETDVDPVHRQVIDEVTNGIPMAIDVATTTTTSRSHSSIDQRSSSPSKKKRKLDVNACHRFAFDEIDLPPCVEDEDEEDDLLVKIDLDASVASESAVFINSVPRNATLAHPMMFTPCNPHSHVPSPTTRFSVDIKLETEPAHSASPISMPMPMPMPMAMALHSPTMLATSHSMAMLFPPPYHQFHFPAPPLPPPSHVPPIPQPINHSHTQPQTHPHHRALSPLPLPSMPLPSMQMSQSALAHTPSDAHSINSINSILSSASNPSTSTSTTLESTTSANHNHHNHSLNPFGAYHHHQPLPREHQPLQEHQEQHVLIPPLPPPPPLSLPHNLYYPYNHNHNHNQNNMRNNRDWDAWMTNGDNNSNGVNGVNFKNFKNGNSLNNIKPQMLPQMRMSGDLELGMETELELECQSEIFTETETTETNYLKTETETETQNPKTKTEMEMETQSEMDLDMQLDMEMYFTILQDLQPVIQQLVLLMMAIQMALSIHAVHTVQQEYQAQISAVTLRLQNLILTFMRRHLQCMTSDNSNSNQEEEEEKAEIWRTVRLDIVRHYVTRVVQSIAEHPLIPQQYQSLHMQQPQPQNCHFQIYRQIAMETLQNMKQQLNVYRRRFSVSGHGLRRMHMGMGMESNCRHGLVPTAVLYCEQSPIPPCDEDEDGVEEEDLNEQCFKILATPHRFNFEYQPAVTIIQ